jgi:hypothetical protein
VEPGLLSVQGYKEAIQIAAMGRSRAGWIKLGQVEKSALCHLSHADWAGLVPILFLIYRQAWEGKVDYGADVKLPADLPDHWTIKVPAGDASWSSSDTEKWKAAYQCGRLLELEGPPPKLEDKQPAKDEKKPASDSGGDKAPKRGDGADTDRQPSGAELDCLAQGGTYAGGACSLPTGQSELDTGDGMPADKSIWPLVVVAAAGVAIVGGLVWYLRKPKRGR